MTKPDWLDKAQKEVEETAAKAGKPDFMKNVQEKAEEVIEDTAQKAKAGRPDFLKKAVDQVQDEAESVMEKLTGQEDDKLAEYTVVAGDNLSAISNQFYGTQTHWKKIYEANKDTIKDPNLIRPGMVLTIPRLD